MVVATKFPSYLVRHPEKRVWLVHQFRQAYELDGTDLGQFDESSEDRALRRKVQALDRVALGRGDAGSSRSRRTSPTGSSARHGLHAEFLPPPPQELEYRCDGYGDFVLSVNRLDRAKRIDLLLEAAALDSSLEIVIAGDGPDRRRLEELARARGLDGRARFAGRVSDAELADLYGRCLAVYYAPMDEDYGMVPVRGVSLREAGADHDGRGRAARDRLRPPDGSRRRARRRRARAARRAGSASIASEAATFGRAGKAIADEVTWDRAIERLLA